MKEKMVYEEIVKQLELCHEIAGDLVRELAVFRKLVWVCNELDEINYDIDNAQVNAIFVKSFLACLPRQINIAFDKGYLI